MPKSYLTAQRLQELKDELEKLKTDARMEVAEQLKRAKEYGDLSENAEYAEAKEEQNRVEARIFELEETLKQAEIIKENVGSSVVEVGSKITIKKDGKTFVYQIVGSNESKPQEGKISNASPLGNAFLGKSVKDKVEVATPGGKAVYEILEIS